jgi:hypothetical protein
VKTAAERLGFMRGLPDGGESLRQLRSPCGDSRLALRTVLPGFDADSSGAAVAIRAPLIAIRW